MADFAPHPTIQPKVKTFYSKRKNKKDPSSWNRAYTPPKDELKQRMVDTHGQERASLYGGAGAGVGALGGAALGGGIGYLAGRRSGHGSKFGNFGAGAGAVLGGMAGGIYGSIKGNQSGIRHGERVVATIPNKAGKVAKLQREYPGEAMRWFPKEGRSLRSHKKRFYHKDYDVKTITTNVQHEPGSAPVIVHAVDRRQQRHKGSVKTGWAKNNYYREDIIEAIIEASLMDKAFIPKNKHEMNKLAKRRAAGHVGHGVLRMVAGAPLGGAGGPINLVRYLAKVNNAKKGLNRGEEVVIR